MSNIIRWENWPHIIEMQQFSRQDLEAIIGHSLKFAHAMMEDRKLPRLSTRYRRNRDNKKERRRCRTIFYQPSSRTESTFESAAAMLGCLRHHIKDPAQLSSAAKGESFEAACMAYTTAGGLGQLRGCDFLIIRHPDEGMPERARKFIGIAHGNKSHIPLPVINAGDGGLGQHPTQTIVDFTTIGLMREQHSHFLEDTTFLIPGELHRNRVIKSLLYGLGKFREVCKIKVIFCCPDDARPDNGILGYLAKHGVEYTFRPLEAFRESIKEATIVYMTRHQSEYKEANGGRSQKSPEIIRAERELTCFRAEYVDLLQPGAFVMHPLPINENVKDPPAEIDPALNPQSMAGDRRLVWSRQSHMGQPVRAASLDIIFAGLDEEADKIYGRI